MWDLDIEMPGLTAQCANVPPKQVSCRQQCYCIMGFAAPKMIVIDFREYFPL